MILLVFSFCSSEPSQEEIQAQIDAAVEEAVEEALANSTTIESTSTTTTIPELNLEGSYWGLYDNGTWATALSTEKPNNFEWAWDIFKQYPSVEFTIEDFHEDSTLIGTLVNFDCSFNRISKTEEHKVAFGVDENTIEYYDTYLEWAQDNYDYLTEDAVITISKIMRGVWTCDYEYLESISTEYFDFYVDEDEFRSTLPTFSERIANFEDNYDDDSNYGKYTYRLGVLLYMSPEEYVVAENCYEPNLRGYRWPKRIDPKNTSDSELAKWKMFDNGAIQQFLNSNRVRFSYEFPLKMYSSGVWDSYKIRGENSKLMHFYLDTLKTYKEFCLSPEFKEYQAKVNAAISSETAFVGKVSSFQQLGVYLFKQARGSLITGARVETGINFDSFIIEFEKKTENNLLPGPFAVYEGGNPCITDEGGCKVPDDFENYLTITGNFCNWDWTLMESTFKAPERITSEDSSLVGKYYGCFEGQSDFLLKIDSGATFKSYRTANPPTLVIEVSK